MTSPQAEKTAGKTMTHDNIRAALAELVALKDLKERFIKFNPQFHWTPEQEREYAGMMLDYERRQHLAWAAARSALSASTQPEGRGEAQRRVHAAGLRALILSIRDLPPGAGTAAMKSLDALEFATPPDRAAASETNGRTELELEQARRIFDLEAQVTSLMEERDIERRAAASAETDSDWPVMPPSLGQSPVLFEDGYAEGWAKCLSECQRVAALAKPSAWTITAPDGRHWSGDSPLKAAAAAQRDTIDPVLAMARINAMVDEENAIRDKELAEAFERGRAAAQAGREEVAPAVPQDPSGPYLMETITFLERKHNPAFGDDILCQCGHPYYRHFDTYEAMRAVGCKYCGCFEFKLPASPSPAAAQGEKT